MRSLVATLALLLWLAPAARAQFAVDVPTRTIETSKLRIRFASGCPEEITGFWYRPFSDATALVNESYPWEFSGQMIQGLWAAQGPIFSQATTTQSWSVIEQSATRLKIRIESQSTWNAVPQTPVRTDYTFFADSSSFLVERTLYASAVPMTNTSLQPYVLRLKWFTFTSGQYRNGANVLSPISYCGGGCSTSDWDQRWARTEGPGIAVTEMYASSNPHPMSLMGDNDSNSQTSWTGALTPTRSFTTDVTWRLLVHCSTTPDNDALEDAIYTWFDGLPVTGAPAPTNAALALAVTPNPARGAASIAYTLPRDGDAQVDVLDVAGRQVATLERGALTAGAHVARWDGRDARGEHAGAGVYFVRVRTATGEKLARLAWLR